MNKGNRSVVACLACVMFAVVGVPAAGGATTLTAGRTTGSPAFTAWLPIHFESDQEIAGVQFDLRFDPIHFTDIQILPGEALTHQAVHSRQLEPGRIRVLIYTGFEDWLASGDMVACQMTIAPEAPETVDRIEFDNIFVTSATTGRVYEVESFEGYVAIFRVDYWHDMTDLSHLWKANPNAVMANVTLRDAAGTVPVFAGVLSGEPVLWDTHQVPDGRYRLKAVFYDSAGTSSGELLREVVINNAVVWHGAELTKSETWSKDFVHLVESVVMIQPGVTLVVEAGVTVKFTRGATIRLDHDATLEAAGSPSLPIIFTSIADDTAGGDVNLDGADSFPQPGDWAGVGLQATSRLMVNDNTHFRFIIKLHEGLVGGDERWDSTHLHRVTENLTVEDNATLTIEPGAVVKFDAGRTLTILSGGKLLAKGTLAQPILFTSIKDDRVGGDTNVDGDNTQPAPGDWGWIFLNGGRGELVHCQIHYGAGPAAGGWGPAADPLRTKGVLKTTGSAFLSLSNSIVADAFYDGVLAWGGQVLLLNSVFVGIDRAISAHPGSSVHVLNCSLYNNRIGLLVHGGTLYANNSIVAESIRSGCQYDFGTLGHIRYCNIWASADSPSVNYRDIADKTGVNGNISANPGFRDPDRRNYRLDFGSPCIDAADGVIATEWDATLVPRFTDPFSKQTGIPAANGEYADMGAYEFAESVPSEIDLIVRDVGGPATIVTGEMAKVQWIVMNAGVGVVRGPWHDAVYLAETESDRRIWAGEVLVGQDVILGPGESFTAEATVRVPGGVVEDYYWQVDVNSKADIFEGANRENNTTASVESVRLDLPELVIDGPELTGRFEFTHDVSWFKFTSDTGKDALIYLDVFGDSGATEIYVGKNYLPTPESFDFRQREWKSADSSVLVANMGPATYYVLAYARSLPSDSAIFGIRATAVEFVVDRVIPERVGNTGMVTLEILGANLSRETVFRLRGVNSQEVTAQRTTFVDSSRVFATFPLTGFPDGHASVVADREGIEAVGTEIVEVADGGQGNFYVYLTAPEVIRRGRSGMWYVTYGNKGLVDVPLPLMRVSVPDAQKISLFESTLNWAESFVLLGMNDRSLLPTLGPGQERTVAVEVMPGPGNRVQARVDLVPGDRLMGDPTPIDWSRLTAPPGVAPSRWESHLQALADQLGHTVGDYSALLLRDLDDLAAGFLERAYVANINGQWVFGPERIHATHPRPDIVLSEEEVRHHVEARQLPTRRVALQGIAGDGVTDTYAVLIADADYSQRPKYDDLPAVAKDLEDMRQYIQKVMRVPEGRIAEVYDKIGSADDDIDDNTVREALGRFRDDIDADDELLIYYSGHGGRNEVANPEGYMVLNDGIFSAQDVTEAIDNAGAGTTIFWNDSCHSGGLAGKVDSVGTSFVGLSGSRLGRVAWDDPTSGGDFTISMKQRLQNCYKLEEAFQEVKVEIEAKYAGQAKIEDRQSPELHNPSGVNIKRKPGGPGGAPALGPALLGAHFVPGDDAATQVVGSFDPNDKVGPAGSGLAGYIGLQHVMPYTIHFENKSTAQAPAQEVLIIDQLDPALDWSTFELKQIGFSDTKLHVPPELQNYSATTAVGTDPNPVRVEVSFDPFTGEVIWLIWSEDPDTGELPENPFAGFLPPNDDSHRGEGFVSYTIRPWSDLETGVEIHNRATIIFDPTYAFNEAIQTPFVANTIDNTPPTSTVLPLLAESPSAIEVEWHGTDDKHGSGIFTYDVFVSENEGPFLLWLSGTSDTWGLYEGQIGRTYRFYSVARDYAGNIESAPAEADATTTVAFATPSLEATLQGNELWIDIRNLVSGTTYLLEKSDALQPGDWRPVWEFVADGSDAQYLVSLDLNRSHMFFRLRSTTPE